MSNCKVRCLEGFGVVRGDELTEAMLWKWRVIIVASIDIVRFSRFAWPDS